MGKRDVARDAAIDAVYDAADDAVDADAEQVRFPRATRLRFVAGVSMVLWVCSFAGFAILVGSRVEDRVLSALGVMASVFFATSFLATTAANKRELRELAALAARADVVAASRPSRRGVTFVARESSIVGSSRPGPRRGRSSSRPPR
jgi:hypothetical protein